LTNKRKILNDPVYGFVTIPSELIFEIIQHPFFQRLRRIKQLGLAELVYPGAVHSRFQHALGAMHLMGQTLSMLQAKGHLIMDIEKEAAQIAILLHDLGHGPFSHVLEYSILENVNHEEISLMLMEKMNKDFNGALTLSIEMFKNTYPRSFFHQLISSQLDMDRMDYLHRDSFFTGVAEGQIGVERIIKMLNVVDNELVVEEKGLLSVENFLVARRLMYWQVYLHKTSICAETMLLKTIERARDLISIGIKLNVMGSLNVFLNNQFTKESFSLNEDLLNAFVNLDDVDIWSALKSWVNHDDSILSYLSKSLLERNLFKIKMGVNLRDDFDYDTSFLAQGNIPQNDKKYFFKKGTISNSAYIPKNSNINILMKNGNILDVSEASDLPTVKALSNIVKKDYICYAKVLSLL
jgi:HD superfamily phosphohydrolase